MRPRIKAVAYMKRMITMRKWVMIPSTQKISETLGTSKTTVRAAIRMLEEGGIVENTGIGFMVIPRPFSELYRRNKQFYYLELLKRNVRIAEMLNEGGRILGNFVIQVRGKRIISANIITGEIIKTTEDELKEIMSRPITVDELLKLKGKMLSKAKVQYLRQKRMNSISETIFHYRRELGL